MQKPALLRGGMVLCWIYAGFMTFALVMLQALSMGFMSDAPEFKSRGGSPESFAFMRNLLLPWVLVSIAAAYGLAKDKLWARPLVVGVLAVGAAIPFAKVPYMLTFVAQLAVLNVSWWYLYRKPNVVAYYAMLREKGPT